MAIRAFLSWSSGKDCAFALQEVRRLGIADVVGMITTINEDYDRVVQHGTRHSLLHQQRMALGLPSVTVSIPTDSSMELYTQRITEAYRRIKANDVNQIVFGDIFLAYVRAARDSLLASLGMAGIYPLWNLDTAILAESMIDAGLIAHVVCLDPRLLHRKFAGRQFDRALLRDLPLNVDPCGENGEFHTVVSAGPMFKHPLRIEVGEIVDRGGFVFADLVSSSPPRRKEQWR
jgi:uncharacterized protein (TIGR00290 family)